MIKLKKNIVYEVTKGNSEFRKGDHIWLSENGHLNSIEGKGWLEKDELDEKVMCFEARPARGYRLVVMDEREYVKKTKA